MHSVRERDTRVLLVEDDAAMATMLRRTFESVGYNVMHARDGSHARALLEQTGRPPRPTYADVIVLDLTLPDVDGLILCAEIRTRVDVPIIVCTARNSLTDRLLSLKLGADAFIAKPFDLEELLVSVEVLLRRVARTAGHFLGRPLSEIGVGALRMRVAAQVVLLGDEQIHLTAIEYRLLLALATRPGVLLSWQQLGHQVWGYHDEGIRSVIQVHLGRLRKKLERGTHPAPAIVPVRGVGYRLQLETATTGQSN